MVLKAVVMAAGQGVRLKPLTETKPKVMLQVAGKPIIHHILLEIKKAGIKEVVIIVKYLKEQIIEYFKKNSIGLKIKFVEQGSDHGTGAAVLTAEKEINDTFVVLAGDIITEASVIKQVIEEHQKKITLTVKKVENPHLYGVVELNPNSTVRIFEEKSEHPKSDLANLSIYCMEPTIFSELKQLGKSARGEYEIVDLFLGAKAVKTEGFWMDVGYPWHLFEANEYLLSKLNGQSGGKIEDCTVKGKVILEDGAELFNSYVQGTTYIGTGSEVGPYAVLKGFNSIGKNCSIGGGTTVKNSIIFDNVNAKHLAYIGDSIIGDHVNFGSGTQLANYRFDEGYVNVQTEKGWVNSGRKKFGSVVGDHTKFGVLACTMPGKLIGYNCWIGSGTIVNQNVPSNTQAFNKNELKFFKNEKK
ncbi:NTP transferase domain-containing protein [Candidatus Micrarchaeota archaeon]|nr:NTP transferase domain-containing protein [Candidatus Micrarchaeota archaeon]